MKTYEVFKWVGDYSTLESIECTRVTISKDFIKFYRGTTLIKCFTAESIFSVELIQDIKPEIVEITDRLIKKAIK